MSTELISKLISIQTDLSSAQNKNEVVSDENEIHSKPQLNINAKNFIPLKEKLKEKSSNIQQKPLEKSDFSSFSPSFSGYINPQRLIPYEEMLKKNIRSFALVNNKNEESKIEKSEKENINSISSTFEINFKFTCDYDLIESEIKEFLDLFGEIKSLDYNMNANSVKIKYKDYFSAININYYLSFLLNDNKKNGDIPNKEDIKNKENNNKCISPENPSTAADERQNEDIVKFIKFLTDNYKTEGKIKTYENKNKSNNEKDVIKIPIITNDKEPEIENNVHTGKEQNNSEQKNTNNSEKKCHSCNINCSKYLFFQQNSETPIKKANIITNYSANNINPNNNSESIKQPTQYHTYAGPLYQFNPSLKAPIIYVPFIPKMNMAIPISIPVLFPLSSPFLKNSSNVNNSNKGQKSEEKENKINSCLISSPNDNPININNINEKENSQIANNNQIKEIFENLNNKIAIISNNSNNSTNSNEKNEKNVGNNENIGSENKTNSEIGSDNKIMSNKSDSTIKTEEINKSSNTKSNNNSNEDNKINKKNDKIEGNNNVNANSSSDKNSSSLDFMSSFKEKTISLDRLNIYLQDNKPITNFANPKISLNSNKNNIDHNEIEEKKDHNEKSISKENPSLNNIKSNLIKDPKISPKNNKSSHFPFPQNNYLNSIFNFLFIPNLAPNLKNSKNPQNMKSLLPNQNFFNIKPNPINFNKNVIDFNKLTLETKNKVHFNTYSSRNYFYKYVCNYVVQIENDNIFKVAQRIIGKNGCFLKKILNESCIKYGDYSTKIRLRGKGSGYIDKGFNCVSEDEPLILSVSSLNYPTYYNCCLLVDKLMNKIYDDYFEHLHMILPKDLHYSIRKKKLIKSEFIVDRVNSIPSFYDNKNNNSNTKEDKKGE